MSINGMPGVVSYVGGRPLYALTVEAGDERINSIYFVTNPDKLSRIPALGENDPVQPDDDIRMA